jgi:hypothetical protein
MNTSKLAVLYEFNVRNGDVDSNAVWEHVDKLPHYWIHAGGGFTKFIPHFLTMEEAYEGSANAAGVVHEFLTEVFASLMERGVIARFMITTEH